MPNVVPVKYFNESMTGAPQMTGQAGSEVTLLRACLVGGFDSKVVTITQTGGVATVTCNAHGRKVNEVVLHAGANEAGYNGEFRVLSAATNTYTVAVDSGTASPATGTITSKVAPAGMSELFAPGQPGNVSNVGVFKPAATHPVNVLQVLDNSPGASSNKWSRWRGYETMTDAISGTGLFPTVNDSAIGVAHNKSSTADAVARNWDLICDNGLFYLLTAWSNSYLGEYEMNGFGNGGSLRSGDAFCTLIFGAYNEAPGTILGTHINYSLNSNLTPTGTSNGKWIARSYDQVGSSRPIGWLGDNGISNYSGAGGLPNPNTPDNGLYWSGISVVHQGILRIKALPGIYQLLHDRNYPHRDLIVNPPGLADRTLIALRANYTSGTNSGMFLFDLTGPWSRN